MEKQWLTWAKQLQAIAGTGQHFTDDVFDRERYEQVADIAAGMLAQLGNVPLARIEGLVTDYTTGYVTPRIDVRGAVFAGDEVLLVQERSDGCWTLPGGYADVGLSAAENVVKEISEEAGINVTATCLVSVRHKAKHDYDQDIRDFYKFVFLCHQVGTAPPKAGVETSAAGFFKLDNLPPLSRGRVIEEDLHMAMAADKSPTPTTIFD